MSHVIEVKCMNNPGMVIKSVLGNEVINVLVPVHLNMVKRKSFMDKEEGFG